MKEQQLKIKYLALHSIREEKENPKSHDIEAIKHSIRRFGMVAPLLIDTKTGILLAGHGRLQALKEMREAGEEVPARVSLESNMRKEDWIVPVITGISTDNADEALAYLVADNRLTELGGWNKDELVLMLEELKESGSIESTGYSDDDLKILRQGGIAPATSDELAPPEAIKQVVMNFDNETYNEIIEQFDEIMEKENIEDHTSVFLFLLGEYEHS